MHNTPTRPGLRDLIETTHLRVADAAWHEGRAAGRREQLAAMEGQGRPCEVSPYAAELRLKLKAARS